MECPECGGKRYVLRAKAGTDEWYRVKCSTCSYDHILRLEAELERVPNRAVVSELQCAIGELRAAGERATQRANKAEAELADYKAENEMLQGIVDEWSSWDYDEQCHVCGKLLPAKRIWHIDTAERGAPTYWDQPGTVTPICVDCICKHLNPILEQVVTIL